MSTEHDPLSDEAFWEWVESDPSNPIDREYQGPNFAAWREARARAEKWLQELDDDNEKLAIENARLRDLLRDFLVQLEIFTMVSSINALRSRV